MPNLIDLPAVADRLGVNHRFIRRLVAERRIPYLKVGRLLRFDPVEIDAILAAGAERAREVAAPTLAEVKKIVCYWAG